MAQCNEALLSQAQQKPRNLFGYWPLWSESIPLDSESRKVDWVRLWANILAGFIIGIRQTLSAIVSATLVFTGTSHPEVQKLFPWGISMMWYSTFAGSAFYGIFGRLQYNTNATQEVCAMLYGAMAAKAAVDLKDTPDLIAPTVLALIIVSTVFTGVCSLAFGQLGLGKFMLRFPTPVTSGFLGTVGYFLVSTAMAVSSGVEWVYFYPESLTAFCQLQSLLHVSCMLAMVWLMRYGPPALLRWFPGNQAVKMLAGLICQLLPLLFFYIGVFVTGVSMTQLSNEDWTYPAQGGQSFKSLWTDYNPLAADLSVLVSCFPSMVMLVIMSVICTMTGVLGIVGKFPTGPDGDPAPLEVIDYDTELTTVGFGAILLGLTNGVVTFHRLGSSVQLRMDGGTHRAAVMSSSLFVAVFFFSAVPLGHFIPKWYLGALFMQSGISFLEGALLSYRSLPPSGQTLLGVKLPSVQYLVTLACVVVAVFASTFAGLAAGLALSIVIFLWESAQSSPIQSVSQGNRTVSRTFRPVWELQVLRAHGDRILLLYLQGQIFFGSGQGLASKLIAIVESSQNGGSTNPAKYCILSFAKVPTIDASAAEQLKAAVRKVEHLGCKVLCCRTNQSVFDALTAAKVIVSPDPDLKQVLGFDIETRVEEEEEHAGEIDNNLVATISRSWMRRKSFKPGFQQDHDSFDHETDALDHCGDKLLAEFCYGEVPGRVARDLAPYMKAYRSCRITGCRMSEEVFEKMNNLPAGTIAQLKPFCQIRSGLASGEILEEGMLYFVLQGAVTTVDVIGVEDDLVVAVHSLQVNMKGFSGRGGGKRLRKRYPLGSVVGKGEFFLRPAGRIIDSELAPKMIVSSKYGNTSEVWGLPSQAWEKLPKDLQLILINCSMLLMAEERQHSLLSGE